MHRDSSSPSSLVCPLPLSSCGFRGLIGEIAGRQREINFEVNFEVPVLYGVDLTPSARQQIIL